MTSWDNDSAHQEEEEPLTTPSSFPTFPYPTPYDIQTQFMQGLFECIDRRKVGIFESPTGTGKSLSMICGAVGWLMERERAERERPEQKLKEAEKSETTLHSTTTSGSSNGTPDWVLQHHTASIASIARQEREVKAQELEIRIQAVRGRERRMREDMDRKKKRQAAGMRSIGGQFAPLHNDTKKKKEDPDEDYVNDAEYLVDEYDSDDDRQGNGKPKRGNSGYGNVSKEVLDLLKRFEDKEDALRRTSASSFTTEDAILEPDVLKIYYCSRTHSQLSQFIEELRKTSYGDHLHVISLGSRKNLCINERFRKMASHKAKSLEASVTVNINKLNDACLDAQKSGTPSDHRCQFLPGLSSSGPWSKMWGSVSSSVPSDVTVVGKYRESAVMTGEEKLLEFRDHALTHVRDIEELAALGTELETCPYYGSRKAVRHCQLVTLPYNLLLHASTRESLKLVVKDNILLLDEAHNLINSLLQMHSVVLPLDHVVLAQDQLKVYLSRFELQLSSINEGYIRVLLRILKALEDFVTRWMDGSFVHPSSATARHQQSSGPPQQGAERPFRPADRVMKVNEFLHDAKMDHINLFKAHTYLEKSGVARKLQGFHESLQRKEAQKIYKEQERRVAGKVKIYSERGPPIPSSKSPSTTPVLSTLDSFLISLLNPDNDGRVIVAMDETTRDDDGDDDLPLPHDRPSMSALRRPVLKFMLLNPARVFRPLVEEARSVVLAGGTMEPVSDLLSHLFPYLKDEGSAHYPRIHRFSCGHVIPKENLMTLIVQKSPTGLPLELSFAQRNRDEIMDGIGQALVNLLNLIPDGVVVFFVSYSYMAQIMSRWQQKPNNSADSSSIMDRIQTHKTVFVEPKESTDADRMLREYHDSIHFEPKREANPAMASFACSGGSVGRSGPKGAVLFSVVGGKMSEGINFSDRLGRGVIMVGMPFPNKGSAELQERMRYMDQVQQLEQDHSSSTTSTRQMTAGSEYYENLCMRAVNQSIGRAIRHRGDYAVIVLLDKRYDTPRIRKKLPRWIGSSIEVCEQFGPAVKHLAGFFRAKRAEGAVSAKR
ncbi:ATP-dependent DNA helicase chl1 [Podila minutissima]|uniref:ATP-dependent DNA helicase CHL1 n=1 Tax=Podila minutissima TaxID=64525 RepID=A0A9P5VLX6_9FUNG|nr:ATP-dependent DNA helicase chl1 [Podila minutissima]